MSKGFQNGISQFEIKIRRSSPILFHSFGNLKKVCKKFFFHVDAIALAAYAEQLLPRSKAAVCCILPHGIVWTHLNTIPGSLSGVIFLLWYRRCNVIYMIHKWSVIDDYDDDNDHDDDNNNNNYNMYRGVQKSLKAVGYVLLVKTAYIPDHTPHTKCWPFKYWWSALSSKVCQKIWVHSWWSS